MYNIVSISYERVLFLRLFPDEPWMISFLSRQTPSNEIFDNNKTEVYREININGIKQQYAEELLRGKMHTLNYT